MIAPLCSQCARMGDSLGIHKGREVYACEAFPHGIPAEVFDQSEPHLRPRPGDRGLVYKPRPGAPSLASRLRELEEAEAAGDFDGDGDLPLD